MMIKLAFLGLCLVAGSSAVLNWASNPVLPGYPVFFISWSQWRSFCDTDQTDEKQCFNDCMTANGMARYIDTANGITPLCPPTMPGCTIPWKTTACQCAKRCECKLGRCSNADCMFCR
ncbi:uncharacterized protein LOC116612381 isoform X1 [Nematostella vectensis]|uniref:uncharacterized protein LOC116612381 isoform X1 n=2 Tax=Nematostella vectensis TaxID=45351 RepID=UPI00207733B7|nr:uncharacterized protein LOC116612381 isoform X1 [Nematostella vectensis]